MSNHWHRNVNRNLADSAAGDFTVYAASGPRTYGIRLRVGNDINNVLTVFDADQFTSAPMTQAFAISAAQQRLLATTSERHVRVDLHNSDGARLVCIANHMDERNPALVKLLLREPGATDDTWLTLALNRAYL